MNITLTLSEQQLGAQRKSKFRKNLNLIIQTSS